MGIACGDNVTPLEVPGHLAALLCILISIICPESPAFLHEALVLQEPGRPPRVP